MPLFTEHGPFFAVTVHTTAPPAPWRPLAGLAAAEELADRIRQVRASLGSDLRVAASIGQLGLVARLVSPVLAGAVRGLRIDLADGYWQPPLDGTVALSMPVRTADPSDVLRRLANTGPVAELTQACGRIGAVSDRVLAGNLASAVNGAAIVLGPAAATAARTVLAGVPDEDGQPGPGFRRRSCCLRYRVAGYCGDCVLVWRG